MAIEFSKQIPLTEQNSAKTEKDKAKRTGDPDHTLAIECNSDLTISVLFDQNSMTASTNSGRSVASPNAAVIGRDRPKADIDYRLNQTTGGEASNLACTLLTPCH